MSNIVTEFEAEELACYLLGINRDEFGGDYSTLASMFWDKYSSDMDYFCDLLNDLLPLITIAKSPLTGKTYKGFTNKNNKAWLVKTEV